MKTKFVFKRHFINSFFIYLACFLIVPLVTTYAVILKTNPKSYERFSFFTDVEFKDESKFVSLLKETLPEDLEYNTYGYYRQDKDYSVFFNAYGVTADLAMLSKTSLDKLDSWDFLVLENVQKYNLPTNYNFKEKSVGILSRLKNSDTLKDYFNFENQEDDYYFVIGKDSVHTKLFTGSGDTNQVDRLLERLLSYG